MNWCWWERSWPDLTPCSQFWATKGNHWSVCWVHGHHAEFRHLTYRTRSRNTNFLIVIFDALSGGGRGPGGNVPDFGRMFLKLKHTDITKSTYIRSWTVTEIMAREKCGLLAVLRTVPGFRDVLPVHCACPSFSLHSAQARSRWDRTCKVLGTLRTTTTLVRVFM